MLFRNAKLCVSYIKAKSAYKSFNIEKVWKKTKKKVAKQVKTKKTKLQSEAEWKEKMINKTNILIVVETRITVTLEKLAKIESRNIDSKIISWKRSNNENTEMEKVDKGKV